MEFKNCKIEKLNEEEEDFSDNNNAHTNNGSPRTADDAFSDNEESENIDKADEDANEHRFSPEVGAERLSKLPSQVHNCFQVSLERCFDALINELKNRCTNYKTSSDPHAFERMWTQMVLSNCLTFKQEHFKTKTNMVDRHPQELVEYMKSSAIVDLLQTFNDVSQQNGYYARQEYEKLLEDYNNEKSPGKKTIPQRKIDDTKERSYYLQSFYRDFVDLYHRCTGTWKPKRNQRRIQANKNNQHAGHSQDKMENKGFSNNDDQYNRFHDKKYNHGNNEQKGFNRQYERRNSYDNGEPKGYNHSYDKRNGNDNVEQKGYNRSYERKNSHDNNDVKGNNRQYDRRSSYDNNEQRGNNRPYDRRNSYDPNETNGNNRQYNRRSSNDSGETNSNNRQYNRRTSNDSGETKNYVRPQDRNTYRPGSYHSSNDRNQHFSSSQRNGNNGSNQKQQRHQTQAYH